MIAWNVKLDSWVIQDGNYPDFTKGQTAEFALYFRTDKELSDINNSNVLQANLVKDCKYKVNAKVVYVSHEFWVINFGLFAYNDSPPPKELRVGSTFSAEIWLEIDYYLYFESYSMYESIPPMIYTWDIQKILQQTAPFIKQISTQPGIISGREILVRDTAKLAYQEIEATDAWKDDNGNAEYTLVCRKLEIPEKRTSETVS